MLNHLGIKPTVIEYDVHNNPEAEPMLKNVRTYYENFFMAKGKTIKFTRFDLSDFTVAKAQLFEDWFEAERLKLIEQGESIGI